MEILNQAQTLVNQYRYLEAFDLVEKSNYDRHLISPWLIEISRLQKQHLKTSAPLPFDEKPFYLAEPIVRFWLIFPILITTIAIIAPWIVISLLKYTMHVNEMAYFLAAVALSMTGGFWGIRFGKSMRDQQIKRYEKQNMERLTLSAREMVKVYQFLIEKDYRSARDTLENGVITRSVARAWLTWINQVYRIERENMGSKEPANAFEGAGFISATIGFMVALCAATSIQINQWSLPVFLFFWVGGWVAGWMLHIWGAPDDFRRQEAIIEFLIYCVGGITFLVTLTGFVLIYMLFVWLFPANSHAYYPVLVTLTIIFPLVAATMAFKFTISVQNLLKHTLGYETRSMKAKA